MTIDMVYKVVQGIPEIESAGEARLNKYNKEGGSWDLFRRRPNLAKARKTCLDTIGSRFRFMP